MTSPATAEDLREAQVKEYGTYIATSPIDVNGARAYNVGDPVPVSNVEAHGYASSGVVESRDQKSTATNTEKG